MVANTIPANYFANVTPGVLSAGGNGLDLIGLMLTENTRVPIGSVLSFPSATSVSTYFGPTSSELAYANVYFAGFDNSNVKPGALLFAQYPNVNVAAYLRGGNIGAALTLAQLQALPASTLTIISDGVAETSASINLSTATSFSDAATKIQAAFTTPTFSVAYDSIAGAFTFTTTATGVAATMDYAKSVTATASACTSSGTVLTVGGTITGTFHVGDMVSGTDGVNSLPTGTYIVNQLTGTTGGAGTYTISAAATPGNLGSAAVTATGYLGTFATDLLLTQATGAVTSQGANAAVPGTFMNDIVALTKNWATFMTIFDPDVSGNANKLLFADWVNTQNDEYVYVCRDTDITPTESTSATTSLGYLLAQSNASGTVLIYEPSGQTLYGNAFFCGMVASIDFTENQGNVNFAYKSQSGLIPGVTDETVLANLIANGYNAYVAAATANQAFNFFYNGNISGPWKWAQPFVNQIWMNNSFQLDMMTLLTQLKSIPYNNSGYAAIHAALQDTINAALFFGAIQPGVTLSTLQIYEVNNAAGVKIDQTLSTRGWYLQVLDASPAVRQARTSPPCTFWYMDGGSINKLNLASIDVQ